MNVVIVIALVLFVAICEGLNEVERHGVEDQLHTHLLAKYNKHVVPYPNSSSPVLVEFSPPIISISNVDASAQTLTTELFLKLVWNDSRLAWKPEDFLGIKVLLLPENQIWKPDVKLLNSAKYAEYDTTSETLVFVHYNGQVVWMSPSTKTTHCEINLRYFPNDVHKCLFKFGSWTHDAFQMDVDLHPSVTENPYHDGFSVAGEWKILASEAKKTTNTFDCCQSSWPDVSFYVTLGRRSPYYKVTIFCPLFAIVILLLSSFWMSPLKSERLTANFIILVMLVLFHLYLSWKLPAVGLSVPVILIFSAGLILLSSAAITTTLLMCNLAKTKPYPVILRWRQANSFKMVSKILRVSLSSVLVPSVDQDKELILMENKINQNPQMAASLPEELWIPLFQIIDRLTFFLCVILIVAVPAYISS